MEDRVKVVKRKDECEGMGRKGKKRKEGRGLVEQLSLEMNKRGKGEGGMKEQTRRKVEPGDKTLAFFLPIQSFLTLNLHSLASLLFLSFLHFPLHLLPIIHSS